MCSKEKEEKSIVRGESPTRNRTACTCSTNQRRLNYEASATYLAAGRPRLEPRCVHSSCCVRLEQALRVPVDDEIDVSRDHACARCCMRSGSDSMLLRSITNMSPLLRRKTPSGKSSTGPCINNQRYPTARVPNLKSPTSILSNRCIPNAGRAQLNRKQASPAPFWPSHGQRGSYTGTCYNRPSQVSTSIDSTSTEPSSGLISSTLAY